MQHPKIIYTDPSRIKLIPHIFSKLSSIMVKCYKQLIYWDLF